VSGDGNPEAKGEEILWTGAIPPSPIRMEYEVEVPAGETGPQEIRGQVEWQLPGHVNPVSSLATPAALVMKEAGTGACLFMEPEKGEDEMMRFILRGESGRTYEIQTSTDLSEWLPGMMVSSPAGVMWITNAPATSKVLFYRAHLLP